MTTAARRNLEKRLDSGIGERAVKDQAKIGKLREEEKAQESRSPDRRFEQDEGQERAGRRSATRDMRKLPRAIPIKKVVSMIVKA